MGTVDKLDESCPQQFDIRISIFDIRISILHIRFSILDIRRFTCGHAQLNAWCDETSYPNDSS